MRFAHIFGVRHEAYPRAVIVLDPKDHRVKSLEFEVLVSAENYLAADRATIRRFMTAGLQDIVYGREKSRLSELLNSVGC